MNSKREAAPTSPLLPSWIIIATVILHAQTVMTWTMLPTLSRRHQPQHQSNVLLKPIEGPSERWSLSRLFRRDDAGPSPLFMVANEDEILQSDESGKFITCACVVLSCLQLCPLQMVANGLRLL